MPDQARSPQHQWLVGLTQLPTAAGREQRVVRWVEAWVRERRGITLTRDASGNLHLALDRPARAGRRPVYFTAHLDHPAFVVDRVLGPHALQLAFLGGVMDEYFERARVIVHDARDRTHRARLAGPTDGAPPWAKHYIAELDRGTTDEIAPGDVVPWDLPGSEIDSDGILHAPACDDLAAVAAALAALDRLREAADAGEAIEDARVLLTRAEEIGFVGATAACRLGTMPADSRVLALENSRSFEDSPIGGGPIVRVGDRLSTFSPILTAAVARRAEEITGGPALPTASQKLADLPARRWQRKLMAGGACEASVFCAYGYDATCLCLPLGNYHNMGDLTAVQAGTNTAPPTIRREHIALADFDGLVDLLVACGRSLPDAAPVRARVDELFDERRSVLE